MSMKGNLSKAPEHRGEVPTKLSELENDAGYAKLNSEGDFTVPGKLHAKEIDAYEDAAHLRGDWQVEDPANEKSIANKKFVEEIIKRLILPEDDSNSKRIGGLTIESILRDEESDYYSTSMAAKGVLLISGSSGVMLQGNESVFIIAPADMSITAGSMVIDAQSLLIGKNGASEPINLEFVYGSSITGLADPTGTDSAVNKGYVDEGFVKKTDIATPWVPGVVCVNASGGISLNPVNNVIYISYAGNDEIDGRTSIRPIVPANLEYAVKSVGDGYYATEEQLGDIDAALFEIMSLQGSYSAANAVATASEGGEE